jgi:hypothetical protein
MPCVWMAFCLLSLILSVVISAAVHAGVQAPSVEATKAATDPKGNTYELAYTIPGLLQHDFFLNQNHPQGEVIAIRFKGARGYLIQPKTPVDSERRWIWSRFSIFPTSEARFPH